MVGDLNQIQEPCHYTIHLLPLEPCAEACVCDHRSISDVKLKVPPAALTLQVLLIAESGQVHSMHVHAADLEALPERLRRYTLLTRPVGHLAHPITVLQQKRVENVKGSLFIPLLLLVKLLNG
jgi:hypothetical protein